MSMYKNKNILVVGCGGVGSEVIKLLKQDTEIRKITVVDYDTIELSNLSRQFIFTEKEKGINKALVVSKKMDCDMITTKIQDVDLKIINEQDIIIGCVDNLSTRMDINYLFSISNCKMLIDCGVEGIKAHAKKITKETACLYCMKELFSNEKNDIYLCSLGQIDKEININNRNQIIKQMIFKAKEEAEEAKEAKEETEETEETKIDKDLVIAKIVKQFNLKSPKKLKTNYFEIYGLYNNIIPNVCFINSICASIALNMIYENEYDFVYYNGLEAPYFNKLTLQKNEECILCNKY